MTRKRFIKLLMSRGIQRNRAQAIATNCNNAGIPYKRAIKLTQLSIYICASVEKFTASIRESIKGIDALKNAISEK